MTSTEYKISVMQAYLEGKEIEISSKASANYWTVLDIDPVWNWRDLNYRIKQEPSILPSINWDEIKDEYKWLAVDREGYAYVYKEKPLKLDCSWCADYGTDEKYFSVNAMKSFSPGNVKWEDILVERPK